MSTLVLEPLGGTYDTVAQQCFTLAPESRLSWVLTASYCYYIENESILSDALYDECCKWLLVHYDEVNHTHKHLITKEMLRAGTAFNLKESDYPMINRVTGQGFIKEVALQRNVL